MRNIKIVADSSADVLAFGDADFLSVPMKIQSDEKEFVDDAAMDVEAMTAYFDTYKGKSRTSCPNVSDWLEAFGDADEVFCITITSQLSGSYNAACIAKQMYEAEHPQRKVFVLDTRSAGPEMKLIIEQLGVWIQEGKAYEQICASLTDMVKDTGLLFMLKSMNNLANNGRVSPVVAKIAGLMGIHLVGRASAQGELEPLAKCRGEKLALEELLKQLGDAGLHTGRVRIAHCDNIEAAECLKAKIQTAFSQTDVQTYRCRGLCSFYAERGGLLVGYEKR